MNFKFDSMPHRSVDRVERKDLFPTASRAGSRGLDIPGKKTAVAVHREVAREIQAFLQVTFAADRKGEGTDMEALETGTRDALHRAGAVVLSRLLEANPGPTATQVPCACGQSAQYHDVRSKQIMTVLGKAELKRAYYVCPRCHKGQSPRDRELDVEGTAFSPGLRRMMATVGSESSFDHGREQLQLLAGLERNGAVERHAEAIGADLAAVSKEMQRALQLEFPEILGQAVPVLYIEMDGTGVPVVKAETEGRAGKMDGQPAHTREAKLGCCFTQTTTDQEGYAVRDEASTTYVGAIETAEEFGKRIYVEAWQRGWSHSRKGNFADGAIWIWNSPISISLRHPNRRSLSCSRASLGRSSITLSLRCQSAEAMGQAGPENARQR